MQAVHFGKRAVRSTSGLWLRPVGAHRNAYTAAADHGPTTLRDATERWRTSTLARKAFGDEVVAHYANAAGVEIAAFDSAITDWEKARNFERS